MADPLYESKPLEIWMDGECRLCRRSQTWCAVRDKDNHLSFRDFRTTDDADLPTNRKAHEATMWARTSDGTLHEGFAAWQLIMEKLPRWRWLGRVTGRAPLRWIGPSIYHLVARVRYWLS